MARSYPGKSATLLEINGRISTKILMNVDPFKFAKFILDM